MNNNTNIRTDRSKWILIALVLIWTLLPFVWFLKMVFMTPADISALPPKLLPRNPSLFGLVTILGFDYTAQDGKVFLASGQARQVVTGLKNSFILSTTVTIITMVVVVPLAYVFGRLEFRHKNKLLFAVLLSVALPPVSTLIPFYILYIRIGLAGTMTGLTIVTLTITIPFVTWMLIGFFRNLPPVERLARIDGFSRMKTFFVIVVPMAKVGIAVGAVIAFLFAWNEYTFAQILVTGTPATTIPPAISGFLYQHPHPAHLASSVLYSLIPPFIVAYLLQRHITKMNIVEPIGR
jgi:multiple sugar transport system permease protein